MYTLRCVPPDHRSDAPGLTLYEAFVRMMALTARQYAFVRTNMVMHLLMTDAPADLPNFISKNGTDTTARMEIVEQICTHGLGQFRLMTDEEYHQERLAEARAA